MDAIGYCLAMRALRWFPLHILFFALFAMVGGDAAWGLEAVTVQLKWKHQFQFAGYYAALEKGFYRKEGLNVRLIEGGMEHPPMDELLTGHAQYAVADAGALLYRAEGKPIVVLANIFQHSPQIILTRGDSGIETPADLRGKRIMLQQGYLTVEVLSMLRHFGVDQFIRQPSSYDIEALIDRRTDAFPAYSTNEPFLMEQRGIPFKIFRPLDYGIDFYGDTLVTTESELENHPARPASFRRATIKGWEYALTHTNEIIDIIQRKYNTQHKSRSHLVFEAQAISRLIPFDLIPIGFSNPRRWQHIADVFASESLMRPDFPLHGFLYKPEPDWMVFLYKNKMKISIALLLLGMVLLILYSILTRRHTAAIDAERLKLRSIVEIQSVPVVIGRKSDGLILFHNNAAVAMMDPLATNEGFIRAADFYFDPHDRDRVLEAVREQGVLRDFELKLKKLDGTPIWTLLSLQPMVFEGEDALFGSFIDITERKQMQEELLQLNAELEARVRERTSEMRLHRDRLQAVIDNSAVAIGVVDKQARHPLFNAAWCHFFGYSAEEMRGKTNMDVMHPDDAGESRALLREVIHGKRNGYRIEQRFIRKDGEVQWGDLAVTAVRDATGDLREVIGVILDISERKRTALQLAESEAKFRALFESCADSIILCNDDGFFDCNEATLKMFGYASREAFLRLHPYDVSPDTQPSGEASQTMAEKNIATAFAHGIHRFEWMHRQFDGTVFPTDIWLTAIELGGKQTLQATIRDISERNRIEHELRLTKEQAEAASKEKSRFLAAASHDLRQPLYAMNLYLESLGVALNSKKQRGLLNKAKQSGEALRGLLNTLLDVSQLDTGIIAPHLSALNLSALLRELAGEWQPQAEAKGLKFRLRDCGSTTAVYSDPVLLARMLRNLLSNAVRHSRRGGILLGCRKAGDHVRIGVWDTGPGIPRQDVEHIFSEFYQLGNPERDRNKGLGLGLAIVRRLSELLEHPVHVRSVPGHGSYFAVDVPLAEAVAHASAAAPGWYPQGLDMSGRFIVVVDDEADILDAMGNMLADWGCEVLLAEDADAAIRELGENGMRRPDAVVADYHLRNGHTGVEAVRRVREMFDNDIPAIVVTGDTAAEVARQSSEASCMIMHKPAQPARLRSLLRYCMESGHVPTSKHEE